jgi:phosphoribosyl 1,2-cyclic phosphodiesterase
VDKSEEVDGDKQMIKFCNLYSGSSGNSHFISDDSTKILIDAGLSGIKIEKALKNIQENPSEIDAIILSHEHSDHSRGIGVLSRRYDIPVYANNATINKIDNLLYNIPEENIKTFYTNEPFEINDFTILPFPVPHDAEEPVGFNIIRDYKKITIATDIGHVSDELIHYLEKSHLILIESNHDLEMLRVGRYPWYLKQRIMSDIGHLSNDMSGKLITKLVKTGCERFILGHLSKENNFPELAYETINGILSEDNIKVGKDIEMSVALREETGIPIMV